MLAVSFPSLAFRRGAGMVASNSRSVQALVRPPWVARNRAASPGVTKLARFPNVLRMNLAAAAIQYGLTTHTLLVPHACKFDKTETPVSFQSRFF